jgi:murein DD-endopeptidase MepM/ murein hydrolase activator NlpD
MAKLQKAPLLIVFASSILAVVGVVAATVMINQTLSSNHDIAIIQPYKAEIAEKDRLIAEYKTEYEKMLQIKESYRSAVKDLVELLYNKDTALGIGGPDETTIPESDDTLLLRVKNSVLSMQDDLRMLLDVKQYLEARKQFSDNFPFIWPVDKGGVPRLSSSYGFRENSELKSGEAGIHLHAGLDIPGILGDDIVATAEGTVSLVQYNHSIFGNFIIIDHKYGFQTMYGHMSEIVANKIGQKIQRGEIIGKMGTTGQSTGVHLHYEIRKDGVSLDPLTFLNINF